MAMRNNTPLNNTNILRFYIDNDDRIVRCDYIEHFDGMMHEEIKLNQNELINLFRRYIEDYELYHEEKIYDRFILFKFYDVDIREIYSIIRRSRMNQRNDLNKFKPRNTKPLNKTTPPRRKRRVTRRNKFDGKKAIVTLVTAGILLTSSFLTINSSPNDPGITDAPDMTDIVIETTTNDYKDGLINNIEIVEVPPQVQPEEKPEVQVELPNEVQYDQYIEINAEDWTETEKYIYAKENYYDLIKKYSKMYGIDPQVALAIACQERGVHSNKVDDGGGIGLYQIQIEGKFNWENQSVYAYNFETNSNEKYTIHKDQVSNLENNIKAGLMIFQECLRRNDYDVARAIQEYNFGSGNMSTVLASCYTDRNPQTEDNKLDWLAYRNVISGGDSIYLENILKFVKSGSVFEFKDKDGKIITCKYINLSMNDMMKKIGY